MNNLNELNNDQLLTACGVMESTIVSMIQKFESQGIDATDLRRGLAEAHAAVDDLKD